MKTFQTLLLFSALFLLAHPGRPAAPSPRPHVLMIVVDDLRDTVGYLENFTRIPTPNIDRLVASGMSFTNAHWAAPACVPSRTAVFTGLRPSTTGESR